MSPLEITLVILLVTIIAFVSGKVPFSVISTGIILALILTGITIFSGYPQSLCICPVP